MADSAFTVPSYEKYSAIRDKEGFSDYYVATGANITKSTFSDWKAGRSSPKIDKLLKIANFLDVAITDLLA